MIKRLLYISLLLLVFTFSAFAQLPIEKATVRGKVVSQSTNAPIANISIKITDINLIVYTDANGLFGISSIPYGSYDLEIGDAQMTIKILVDETTINLGALKIDIEDKHLFSENAVQGIAFDDIVSLEIDEGSNNYYIPAVQTNEQNQTITSSITNLLPLGFRLRGYVRKSTEVYINGLRTNNLLSGIPNQNQWVGLQNIMSSSTMSLGLQYNEQFMGGVGGLSNITAYAADLSAKTSIAYTLAHRIYKQQINFAHHTGLLPNGWAISAIGNIRHSEEGYVQGTYYHSYGYALALSKAIRQNSRLHILTYGTSIINGNTSPVTEELYQLSENNYYNPNWGYQEGEKRNAKEYKAFIPATILNWEYEKSNSLRVNIGISYQTGQTAYSSLDWYNAADPRPDYYANLPSYYLNNPQGINEEEAIRRIEYYKNNPDALQINWEKMYEANRMNRQTINGITGNRSVYALGQDKVEIDLYSAFANFRKSINEHLNISGGVNYQIQQTEHYREMIDLLGGDYYVNHNRFAELTFLGNEQYKQNDIKNPDGIIREEDKYNYHYNANVQKGDLWLQALYYLGRFDLFAATSFGTERFYRNGIFQNGVYANESYGKSETLSFITWQLRAGITYKINGKQNILLNVATKQEAPKFDNIFIAPRIRNTTLQAPKTENIQSIELGYLYAQRKVRISLTGYATDFIGSTQAYRFYHEEIQNFVTYTIQNINSRYIGTELAIKAKLIPDLTSTTTINLLQAFYTNRPNVSIYKDNDTSGTIIQDTVYWQNYYIGNVPQSAFSTGLNYFYNKIWNVGIVANYTQDNYIAINPTRRTEQATALVNKNSEQYQYILAQQKLPNSFTLDFRIGTNIKIAEKRKWTKNPLLVHINAGINNILNNQNIVINAYEQLRYDYNSANPDRFPPKHYYAQGRNYYLNIKLSF